MLNIPPQIVLDNLGNGPDGLREDAPQEARDAYKAFKEMEERIRQEALAEGIIMG